MAIVCTELLTMAMYAFVLQSMTPLPASMRIPQVARLAALTLRLKAPVVSEFTPDSLPSLHLLPCRIAHTGPAAVPNYFRPAKAEVKAPVLTYGVDGAELKEGRLSRDSFLRDCGATS